MVGSNTYVAVAACVAAPLVVWALSANPIAALGALGIVAVVALVNMFGNWRFADKHPELAAVGGTDYVKLRQIQMAAKDLPVIPVDGASNPAPIIDVTNS